MFDLTDHVAIVTDGASGIGRGIAASLSEAGASVIIADVNLEHATATAKELGASAIHVDVTDRTSVQEMYRHVVATHGGFDIVCSNAGVFPNCPLAEMTDEQWEAMFAINTHGTFKVVQEALPYLQERRYGRIVITTSITGSHTGFPGWAHYGASNPPNKDLCAQLRLKSLAMVSPLTVFFPAISSLRASRPKAKSISIR